MSKNQAAKTLRIVTIPPLLVAVMLTLLYILRPIIFQSPVDYAMAILSLSVIPTLAYPLQSFIPGFKDGGRDAQRRLAFIFSPIGYAVGFIYALIANTSIELKFIFGTYLASVIVLLIFNKLLHIKASGHACGVFGPLIHTIYFLGLPWFLPCAFAVWAVVWSSLYLMRHTKRELFFGGMTAMTSFIICATYFL